MNLADMIANYTDGIHKVQDISDKITASAAELKEEIESTNKEMADAAPIETPAETKWAKRKVNTLAHKIDHFANMIKTETVLAESTFDEATNYLNDALESVAGSNGENMEEMDLLKPAITDFHEVIGKGIKAVKDFSEVIRTLPRVTPMFNRAKKAAISSLARLNKVFASTLEKTDSAIESSDSLSSEKAE